MNDLAELKKKLCPIIIENSVLLVIAILLLPTLFTKLNEYFIGERIMSYHTLKTVTYGFVGIPYIVLYGLPLFKRFFDVFRDLKHKEKKTIIVNSSRKNKKDALLSATFLKEQHPNIRFYFWKAKPNKYCSYRFIVPDTIKGPKGYAESNYYAVTYYSYSKLVTKIEGPLDPRKISKQSRNNTGDG